jgi:hypothetical protein
MLLIGTIGLPARRGGSEISRVDRLRSQPAVINTLKMATQSAEKYEFSMGIAFENRCAFGRAVGF